MPKSRKIILAAIAFVVLLVLVFILMKPNPPPPVKLPSPNGYDDLVKAGQMFVGNLPDCNWSQPDDECLEEMRNYLKVNGDALKIVRVGLSRETRMATEFTQTYASKHLPELANFKRLAQTVAAEGKVAEKENRIDDAIQSYLDAARLSEAMRGGLMIDALVGISIEAIGIGPLQKLSSAMTLEQRRKVIKTLTQIYSNRDSLEETLKIERNFIRRVHGIRGQFTYLATFILRRGTERKFQVKIEFRRTRLGLLLTDLALRNYESEKGHAPKTLQELVPEYLPFLPKDDFSGKDFIYRPLPNGYELYGVGSDEIDDGGKPFVRRGLDSPGDMLPDSQY